MSSSTVVSSAQPEAATKTHDLKIAVSPFRRARHRFASASDNKDVYNPADEYNPKDERNPREDNYKDYQDPTGDPFSNGDPMPRRADDD